MAHITAHAAIKGQLEQDPLIQAAFEKMVATGTSAHHAEHVLSALLPNRVGNRPCRRGWKRYREDTEALHPQTSKIVRDPPFRKKLADDSRLIIVHLNSDILRRKCRNADGRYSRQAMLRES